jgi:DNA polymerase
MLYLDFETRSAVDIKKSGAEVYARHPSTEIMCVGIAENEDPAFVFLPKLIPAKWLHRIHEGETVVAHNAAFELAIFNHACGKYDFPYLKPEQTVCTLAMSYAMALPGALADAAPAMGMTNVKDAAGHRTMLQLSQPRKVIEKGCIFCAGEGCVTCYQSGHQYDWYTPEDSPEKFQQLYDYCAQDIEVERGLYKRLVKLSQKEQEIYLLDRKINDRGVRVDLKAVKAAISIVELEQSEANAKMREVTKNAVATTTATGQLTEWINQRGVECKGVAKADVADLLQTKLPFDVREALLIRQSASKSSTAKLKAMVARTCEDGHLRGAFQYHGAGATGRFAGRGVNLQNLKRSTVSQEDIEGVFSVLERTG